MLYNGTVPRLAMIALVVGTGCRIHDLELSGKQCPCPAPYVCDLVTNTCAQSLAADAAPNDMSTVDAAPIAPMPACTGAGIIFCDSFMRAQPIATNDPTWFSESCDAAGALTVDGALEVSYSVVATGTFAHCALDSLTAPSRTRYQIDFDMTGTTASVSTDYIIPLQLVIPLAAPNADGIDEERIEMVISPSRHANVSLVYHYPDASKSPTGTNYAGYGVAEDDGHPFFLPNTACHYTYIFEPVGHRGIGQSVCNGVTTTLVEKPQTIPAGLGSAPNLILGFEDVGFAMPQWSLSYDNLVMRSL
jgi:hypothetical protein